MRINIRIVFLICIALLQLKLYAQNEIKKDSVEYKNSITFDPVSSIIRVYSFSYTRSLKHNLELHIKPQIRIAKDDATNDNIFTSKDPYWLYDYYTINAGVRYIFPIKMYIELLGTYRYAFFDKQEIIINEDDGQDNDHSQILERSYNGYGFRIKSGFILDFNRLRLNPHFCIGHLSCYSDQTIYDDIWGYSTTSYDPPQKSTAFKKRISFHMGLELGFRF